MGRALAFLCLCWRQPPDPEDLPSLGLRSRGKATVERRAGTHCFYGAPFPSPLFCSMVGHPNMCWSFCATIAGGGGYEEAENTSKYFF